MTLSSAILPKHSDGHCKEKGTLFLPCPDVYCGLYVEGNRDVDRRLGWVLVSIVNLSVDFDGFPIVRRQCDLNWNDLVEVLRSNTDGSIGAGSEWEENDSGAGSKGNVTITDTDDI